MYLRRWQSGQLQETVNLPDLSYAGSNPARRTNEKVSIYRGFFLGRDAGSDLTI